MLHPLKCATAEVKKIVLHTLLYFIKRYVTFLQGIVIFIFLENLFVVAKSTDHYKFTHAIIKNWCIIFTFNIFIYCVILVFELFIFLPYISLHFFFPFNFRLYSAIISNVIKKKKKNPRTMYFFYFLFFNAR